MIDQCAAMAFAPCFGQGRKIINIKMFALKSKLQVTETDHRCSVAVFSFNKSQLVTFRLHVFDE